MNLSALTFPSKVHTKLSTRPTPSQHIAGLFHLEFHTPSHHLPLKRLAHK